MSRPQDCWSKVPVKAIEACIAANQPKALTRYNISPSARHHQPSVLSSPYSSGSIDARDSPSSEVDPFAALFRDSCSERYTNAR